MLSFAAKPASSAEPPSAIIVFDGSGSMWGKLDGERQTKLVLARDAVRASLAKLKPEMRLGFASFGHRRSSDCADTQVLIVPEAGAAEKIGAALEKHSPRGKGPLTLALKDAAKAFGKDNGAKTLVLVHDDSDNCVADPCASLGEIQAAAPGVVIHVVGLGLKGEEAQRLQCLTRPTRGKLVDAQNAQQIAAGLEEVLQLAAADAGSWPRPPPVPVQAPRPVQGAPQPAAAALALPPRPAPAIRPAPNRPALATEGPPALRLAALLAVGAPPHARPVRWTVQRDDLPDAPVLFGGSGQDVLVALPPGAYRIEAEDGFVSARQSVTVAPKGHTGLDVVLNAGLIRLRAPSGQTTPADGTLSIFEAPLLGALAGTVGRAIGMMEAHEAETVVPVGRLVLRLDQGSARVERTIEVAAGAITEIDAAPPFGILAVAVSGTDPANPVPIVVAVFEDDPDAPRGRREFARSAAVEPRFTLPAGTYTVIASQGPVEARERVSVGAGDSIRRSLVLAAARLSITSELAGASRGDTADDPVSYRIERLDVLPPEVHIVHRRRATLDLPAGRYRIEARHGAGNARSSRDVELVAGQPANVVLIHNAGTVRLRLPTAMAQSGEVVWEIVDTGGRPIWSTAEANPRATLAAGRYLVRAESRDKRVEQILDVKAGDSLAVELRE